MNNKFKNLTLILYVIYLVSIITGGFLSVMALIANYIKRKDVKDTMYESHFTWQIRTFWWNLLLNIIAFTPIVLVIWLAMEEQFIQLIPVMITWGVPIAIFALIWNIYRLIRGLLNVIHNKEI